MSAEAIARALGGRPAGRGVWRAPCPVHGGRSLSLRDGDRAPLVTCWNGCDRRDVLSALRAQGLLGGEGQHVEPDPQRIAAQRASERAQAQAGTDAALRIWRAARSAAGTLAEDYLRARGLALARGMPARLRYAERLQHTDPHDVRTYWPALVALVTDRHDRPIGVHRTYLARDGSGKAPVTPNKKMRGIVRGGAVRLAPAAERIVVAEGIETALSAAELSREPLPAWAALSAVGIEQLALPDVVRDVVIAADPDAAGLRVARAAARRWRDQGRAVRVLRPLAGGDFNDALQAQRRAQESSHAHA